jgi:hypothetical protein
MNVFVVMGRFNYSGYVDYTMKIFYSRSSAENYVHELTKVGIPIISDNPVFHGRIVVYDYATIFEHEILV